MKLPSRQTLSFTRERSRPASFSARYRALTGVLLFVLSSLPVFAEEKKPVDPAADLDQQTAGLFDRSAGALNIRPGKDGSVEPVHIEYGYETVKESDLSDKKLMEAVAASVPEGSDHPVIDVFAEATPKGRKRGAAIATRIRNVYRKIFGSKKKIDVEVYEVPEPLTGATNTVKSEFLKGLSKPTEYDIRTGAIVGTYSGTTAFMTWFSTPGVTPMTIVGLTAFQLVKSGFHSVFSSSISKTFRINVKKPGAAISPTALFIRRQFYSLFLAELTRFVIGSPPHGLDALNTITGQLQLLTLTMGMSGLDNILFGMREKAFLDSPKYFARMYLATYFILSPWQSMDSAGTFPVILDLTIYKVRASTFGMLATYLGLYQSLRFYPTKVAAVLDKVFDPMDRFLIKAHNFIGGKCQDLIDTVHDITDDFRDFIH